MSFKYLLKFLPSKKGQRTKKGTVQSVSIKEVNPKIVFVSVFVLGNSEPGLTPGELRGSSSECSRNRDAGNETQTSYVHTMCTVLGAMSLVPKWHSYV